MNKKPFFVFIIILGVCIGLVINSSLIENVEYIEMDINITNDSVGLNLDADKIHFGNVPRGSGSAFREMHFFNANEYDMTVIITSSGDMEEWLVYEKDEISYGNKISFVVEGETNLTLKYTLDIPEDIEYGFYEGLNKVVWKRKVF